MKLLALETDAYDLEEAFHAAVGALPTDDGRATAAEATFADGSSVMVVGELEAVLSWAQLNCATLVHHHTYGWSVD